MEDKELIYGRNPVFEYIKSSSAGSCAELYIQKSSHGKIIESITKEAAKKNIRLSCVEKDFFSAMSSSVHQGVALKIKKSSVQKDLSSFLDTTSSGNGIVVLLDQITDPHNAGAIIRTAEALGCQGIVMPKNNSVGINPTVVKSSAGATAHIDIFSVTNAASFIETAKSKGFWVIGTSDKGTADLRDIKKFRPAVIVIGSEGSGMRRLTEDLCDQTVRIPLKGRVSSLNASIAAGIVIFEITRDD